jgi:hypothetical protein
VPVRVLCCPLTADAPPVLQMQGCACRSVAVSVQAPDDVLVLAAARAGAALLPLLQGRRGARGGLLSLRVQDPADQVCLFTEFYSGQGMSTHESCGGRVLMGFLWMQGCACGAQHASLLAGAGKGDGRVLKCAPPALRRLPASRHANSKNACVACTLLAGTRWGC